jgi:hypothetical protein
MIPRGTPTVTIGVAVITGRAVGVAVGGRAVGVAVAGGGRVVADGADWLPAASKATTV